MKRPFQINILLICALFLLSQCSILNQLGSIKYPSLSYDSFSVSSLNFEQITLMFNFDVDNPNPVDIKTSGYGYEFNLNGNSFLSGSQETKTTIGGKSKSAVQVPVTFNFKDMYNTFTSMSKQDSTSFELATEIIFDLPVLGATKLPVKASGFLPVVKMPDIQYKGFNVKNMSFSSVDLEFSMNVTNPNYFGLSLNKLNYGIDINGASLVESSLNDRLNVSGKKSTEIRIPVKIELAKVGLNTLQSMISGKPFDYRVKGTGSFDVDLPYFKQHELLPFDLKGNLSLK